MVQRVASDLGGVDVYQHYGRARCGIPALTNAFVRRRQAARVDPIAVHRELREWTDVNCRRARPRRTLYEPAAFRDIVFFATVLVRGRRGSSRM